MHWDRANVLLIAPRWPSQSWFSNTSGITMRGASRTATVSRPPSHAGDQGVPSQFAVALSDCVADLWQSFVETGLPRAAAQLAADCRRKSTLGLYAVSYNLLKSCVHVPRRPRFPRLQTRTRPFPQGTIQRRKTSHYHTRAFGQPSLPSIRASRMVRLCRAIPPYHNYSEGCL